MQAWMQVPVRFRHHAPAGTNLTDPAHNFFQLKWFLENLPKEGNHIGIFSFKYHTVAGENVRATRAEIWESSTGKSPTCFYKFCTVCLQHSLYSVGSYSSWNKHPNLGTGQYGTVIINLLFLYRSEETCAHISWWNHKSVPDPWIDPYQLLLQYSTVLCTVYRDPVHPRISLKNRFCHKFSAGIREQCVGVRNGVGIGLPYRPEFLYFWGAQESIPRNQFRQAV